MKSLAFTCIIIVSVLVSPCLALGDVPIDATRIVTGLSKPLFVASPPGDNDRLFIVEQGASGTAAVKEFKYSTGQTTTFMTVTGLTNVDNEQGLLGLAFDPGYQSNGRFYLNYTTPGVNGNAGLNNVARYTRSTPDSANESTKLTLLTVDHPAGNHNGGWLGFGPTDGDLYISIGDGGDGNDIGTGHTEPNGNGQDLSKMLGKILRIDVTGPPDPGKNYAIPPTNPYVNLPGAAGEVYDYGLRNPWRPSFDTKTHDLYIADVGQDTWEEVDVHPASAPAGINFGWRKYEGNHIRDPNSSDQLEGPGTFVPPIAEYNHNGGSRSITGGYVYRDNGNPALDGTYFYADFVTNQMFELKYDGSSAAAVNGITITPDTGSLSLITSFGQDNLGRIYVVTRSGNIYRLDPALPGDANQDGVVDGLDLTALASHWQSASGMNWVNGDFTNDGKVNISDLLVLATHWSANQSLQAEMVAMGLGSVGVPEPLSGAILMTLVAFGLCGRQTRRIS